MSDQVDLEAVMQRWADAVERDDAAGCSALCTEDAIILSSDAPTARGRDAIEALVQTWIDAGERNDRPTTLAGGVEGGLTETGRYIVVFRREADDAWRIAALSIFASDLP